MESPSSKNAIVAVEKLRKPWRSADIEAAVWRTMEASGMVESLCKFQLGATVLVKPNVVADLPSELGATTDPRVVMGICQTIVLLGLRPIVCESSAIGVDTILALDLEYGILRDAGYPVIALDGTMSSKVDQRWVELFDVVRTCAAVITVPKLKTHDQTTVSLGLKNLKGLLPDKTKMAAHHRGLHTSIVDVFEALTKQLNIPVFSIVDGLVGMEGLGPVYGQKVDVGVVIAGVDALAVDAYCCWLMGVDPHHVNHLQAAEARKLGSLAYALKASGTGETPDGMQFVRPEEVLSQLSTEGLTFHWEQACTGCRNTILSYVYQMESEGAAVKRPLTFVAGEGYSWHDVVEYESTKVMVIGNCALLHLDCKSAGARCVVGVQGCPPTDEEMSRALSSMLESDD